MKLCFSYTNGHFIGKLDAAGDIQPSLDIKKLNKVYPSLKEEFMVFETSIRKW